MSRLRLLCLALVAGCLWPRPAPGIQTFLPAGGYELTGSLEVELDDLETPLVVSSLSEGFFFLLNLEVTNHGLIDCTLRAELHNVSGDIPDGVITSPIAGGATVVVQVPIVGTSGTTFGLGAEQFQVFVTKQCNAAFSFTPQSYLGIFSSSMGGGSTIGVINGETGFAQTFAVGSSGTDFNLVSGANVHTFHLPAASLTAAGKVTTGAQTFNGIKTFDDGIIAKSSTQATSTQIGSAAAALGASAVAIGQGAQATAASTIALGASALASVVGAIGIGAMVTHDGDYTVAMGNSVTVSAACDGSVVIGKTALCQGVDSVMVGIGGSVTADFATAVGGSSSVTAEEGTAIGNAATVSAEDGTALGASAAADADNCIALGRGANCSVANTFVVGAAGAATTAWLPQTTSATDLGSSTVVFEDLYAELWHGTGWRDDTGGFDFDNGNLLPLQTTQEIGALLSPLGVLWVTEIKSFAGFRDTKNYDIVSGLMPDGVSCANAVLNIGATIHTSAFYCTDNAAGYIQGVWASPDGWNGTALDFELQGVNTNAAPAGVSGYNIACVCASDNDVPGAFGTTSNADQTWAVEDRQEQWGAAVTCAGTCLGGDTVYWQISVDATATTTTQVTEAGVMAIKFEFLRGPILGD